MNFEMCPKCKQYAFMDDHNCKPFRVYYPEYYGDEWVTKWGLSKEGVIENIAENLNSDDPIFEDHIFESPISIKGEDGIIKSFNCIAQVSIDYYTRDVDTPDDLPEDLP